MKKMLIIVITFLLLMPPLSCSPVDSQPTIEIPGQSNDNNSGDENLNEEDNNMKLVIKINSAEFVATLFNNSTADSFKLMLPLTVKMNEHAGNEKYYNMSQSLPVDSSNPGTIYNGDIMLYGSETLVLFYKTFTTSYSYTKIGRVDNPTGLERALGTGNVTVTFELVTERI